jgi:hypothetical protein
VIRFLKLEAGWILTNMAYGEEKELLEILRFDNFGSIIDKILN